MFKRPYISHLSLVLEVNNENVEKTFFGNHGMQFQMLNLAFQGQVGSSYLKMASISLIICPRASSVRKLIIESHRL